MALGANGEEERSLRDDLAASLKEIEQREASETTAAPEQQEAATSEAEAKVEPTETKADRGDGRDAHGKFVAKPKEEDSTDAEQPTQAAADPSKAPESQASGQPASQPESEADAPPKSWRADEAQAWKDLPATAKAAILRREADAAKIAGQNDAERMFGREMADMFRPHVQEIQAAGATPQLALKQLLANHNDLRSNDPQRKFGTARRMLAEYGIDLGQLAQIQMPDQNIMSLQTKIAQLEQRLAQPQGQQFAPLPPSVEESNIASTIEAFKADPAHPHFDAVRPIMGQLLETGAAPDLESAYHAAVAMTPALRSTVASAPAANPTRKDPAAARQAAASVTGSPGPTGNPSPMSLRDELRENLRSAGFSV